MTDHFVATALCRRAGGHHDTAIRVPSKTGFNLIELLVVLALLALVAFLLVRALHDAAQRGREAQTLSDGRQAARALQEAPLHTPPGAALEPAPISDPSRGVFATSTEYFQYLVTNGVLNVKFAFFAVEGVPALGSTNAAEFTGRYNAWNVVTDINDSTPDGTPFMFTKNLDITSVRTDQDFRAHLKSDVDSFGNPVPAFGAKAVCVVGKGGSAMIVKADQLQENFTPPGATNRVLRAGK